MILVVGLVVGLAGIAAAFYFSIGPGRKRGRGARAAASPHRPGDPRRDRPPAARPARDAEEDDAPRTRRRVGWRNSADVDEELWPTEAFGGVSDEQFWDDLAADKPLATTARTAQHGDTPAGHRNRADRARPDRVPGLVRPGSHATRPPVPAARTDTAATQHIPTARADAMATQPVAARPAAGATQPAATARPAPAPARPDSMATQHIPAVRPDPVATQPVRVAGPRDQPATSGPRGRGHRKNSDDDPLTSAAFSLRASGPVDGRSFRRQPEQADPAHGRGPYTYPAHPYGAPVPGDTATASAHTPPYGEDYGTGGYPSATAPAPGQADRRRQPDGRRDQYPAEGYGAQRAPYPPAQPRGNGSRGPYDDRRLTAAA